MSVNEENVRQIIRVIDVYISANNSSNDLTEESIAQHIDRAVNFLGTSPLSKEELEAVKRDISYKYQIFSLPGQSIVSNYEEEMWYEKVKNQVEQKFWSRYKDYLIDEKKFSPNVVSLLGDDTLNNNLMNFLGNPNSNKSFLKRGLVIGDVQSGKTSTYIGLICKAADAGYKVFILLTGTTEDLRKQTQERVEEGFIGINIDADTTGGKRVGVGLDNLPIRAGTMTSRNKDFTAGKDKIVVSLEDKNAIVFVIKKNAAVLQNLTDWLVSLNADTITKKIDLPMLLIDDEADNASINTSKEKVDPTKINEMIRTLANVFTKSNYVGFTATPFANVFIDPESTDKMANQDLFPEDFIVALPTPSNYIGAKDIFCTDGKYHSQLNYIEDAGIEEEDNWPFYYKHKKDWEGELPNSLTDALYCFYIVNAIRDLRYNQKSHRSMLINISRFRDVQRYVKDKIEEIHNEAYRAIKFNINSINNPIVSRIHQNWEKHYKNTEFSWNEVSKILFSSIEDIKITVVNSSKFSTKLNFNDNSSTRVIAIGGLALSRGLTLEGLIISYFYRNTCTYDVLMQMGRWFGYRKGYEDLFRIWIHKDSAKWYAEIAKATETLKSDMSLMREQELKPRNFGIRVRDDSEELHITALNKMRNATAEYEICSYYGNIVETPYLIYDAEVQKNNFEAVKKSINIWVKNNYRFVQSSVKGAGTHNVMYGVSKIQIINFLREMKVSNLCSYFDTKQIIDFLQSSTDPILDLWNIVFMDGVKTNKKEDQVNLSDIIIYKLKRNTCRFDKSNKRLSLGRSGKMGGTHDGMIGIEGTSKEVEEILENAKKAYEKDFKSKEENLGKEPSSYKSDVWFKYIKNRKPVIIVYLIDVDTEDQNQRKQADQFKMDMEGCPVVGLAMGLPNSDNAEFTKNRFSVNKVYNWFEKDDIVAESEEE